MQKTIYICLMTILISLTAHAIGGYNENDGINLSEYGFPKYDFWGTKVSNMVAENRAMAYSMSSYEAVTTKTLLKSGVNNSGILKPGESYGDCTTSNGTGWQVCNLYSSKTEMGWVQVPMTGALQDANDIVSLKNGTHSAFNYNLYDASGSKVLKYTYYSSAPGSPPVLISSSINEDPMIMPYFLIPRGIPLGSVIDMTPGSIYDEAQKLNQKSELTLEEAAKVIQYFLDPYVPDTGGIRGTLIKATYVKVEKLLPDEFKGQAAELVIEITNSAIVTDTTVPANPFVDGKNYVFGEDGKPKEAGAEGDLVQILVGGVPKSPSQLSVTDVNQMKALSKVAVFLAKKVGAPVGSRFGTGTWSTYLASESPAFTSSLPPNWTIFNHHGGSLSTDLNNVNSFTNIIQHELGHQKNYKLTPQIESNCSTHIDVYLDAIEKTSFLNSPPDYRLGIIKSLANYIWNMDKKPGTYQYPYDFTTIKEKIDKLNQRSYYNGGYRLIAPMDGANVSFPKGSLGTDDYPFRVYDPYTNIEKPVDFKLNNEK